MDEFTADRRRFLALGGMVTAGSLLPSLEAVGWSAAQQAAVLVHDPALAVPADLAARLASSGGKVVALDGDPVRLWRDGLAARVRTAGRLYGYTLWADVLIFRGLAREVRFNLRREQLDAASGCVVWMIA